jgi:hypothetical protein
MEVAPPKISPEKIGMDDYHRIVWDRSSDEVKSRILSKGPGIFCDRLVRELRTKRRDELRSLVEVAFRNFSYRRGEFTDSFAEADMLAVNNQL